MLVSHCSWKGLVCCFISEWVGLFEWGFCLFLLVGWVFLCAFLFFILRGFVCVCLCLCVLSILLKYMDRKASGPTVQKKGTSGQGTKLKSAQGSSIQGRWEEKQEVKITTHLLKQRSWKCQEKVVLCS